MSGPFFWSKKIQKETASPALATVFTLTKNEYDLVNQFVTYHGWLFGYKNVVVIDNGSTHKDVLDLYDVFRSKGVTILTADGYSGDLQGKHYTDTLLQYKEKSTFLIPLDTDLFFTVKESCDRDTIISFLENLPTDYDMFIMNMFFMSVVDVSSPNYSDHKLRVPTDCTTFVKRRGYGGFPYVQHTFYRASNFVWTSNGNHVGGSTTNRSYRTDDVAYIHFHSTGVGRNIERCSAILEAYGYIDTKTQSHQEQFNALNGLCGNGGHRIQQYVEYLRKVLSGEDPFVEEPIPSDVFIFEGLKNVLRICS
jgi:hypothetical protein